MQVTTPGTNATLEPLVKIWGRSAAQRNFC